jgi:putative sterol carrier protein
MTAVELLHLVPSAVDAAAAAGVSAVIQYKTSTPVYHRFENGVVSAVTGTHEKPDVTVVVSDRDLLRLFEGDLKLGKAVLTGKLRVRGDLLLAQKLLGLVDRAALDELRPG